MYHILDQSQGPIIALQVEGSLSQTDYETLLPFFKSVLEKNETIRIIVFLKNFTGFSLIGFFKAFWFGLKYSSCVEKKAIITNQEWVSKWAKISSPLFKTQVQCFSTEHVEEAWEWIRT